MRRPKIETDDERSERIIRGFCQRFCESYWRELDAKRTARLAEIQPPAILPEVAPPITSHCALPKVE